MPFDERGGASYHRAFPPVTFLLLTLVLMPSSPPPCSGLCWLALAVASLSVFAACNRVQEIKPTKEVEVLYKIQSAYDLAYNKVGRPLKDFEELKPFLADVSDPQTQLVSPNDGKPYVILYGIDRRNFDKGIPVLAYEQTGKDGVRRVLTAMGIDSMDEATFRNRVPQAAGATP